MLLMEFCAVTKNLYKHNLLSENVLNALYANELVARVAALATYVHVDARTSSWYMVLTDFTIHHHHHQPHLYPHHRYQPYQKNLWVKVEIWIHLIKQIVYMKKEKREHKTKKNKKKTDNQHNYVLICQQHNQKTYT